MIMMYHHCQRWWQGWGTFNYSRKEKAYRRQPHAYDSVLWAHVKNQTEGSPGRLPKALEEDASPHLQFEATQWLWGWGWGKKHPFPWLFSCKAGEMRMRQQCMVEALWARGLYAGHTDVAVWAWRRSEVNWQHGWWKGQGTEPLDRPFPSDYGKFAFILKPYLFFW